MKQLFLPFSITLLLGASALTGFNTPDVDEVPQYQNGFYLVLGYHQGTKDTFMRDTFSLERNGDRAIMRPQDAKKIKKPLEGLIDDDIISMYSRDEDAYGGGAFFFHCKLSGDTIMGHGGLPKKQEKLFRVELVRIAIPLIDPRDGERYATIRLGKQFWMAENLRYVDPLKGSFYNDDNPKTTHPNPKIYGRLYTWEAAQRACPKGWHLPNREEWTELVNFLNPKIAGTKLKSATGWGSMATDGKDAVGFSAYPAGYYNPETDNFKDLGVHTFFWAIDQQNVNSSWYRNIFDEYPGVYEFNDRKAYGLSCRCIQD